MVEALVERPLPPLNGHEPSIASVEHEGPRIRVRVTNGAPELAGWLRRQGAHDVRVLDISIEQLFLALVNRIS